MRTQSLCFEVTLYLDFTIINDKNVSRQLRDIYSETSSKWQEPFCQVLNVWFHIWTFSR